MFFFAIKRPLFACSTIAPSLMLLTVTAMAAPMEAGPPTQPTSLLVHRVADTDAISAGEKKDRRDHHVAKRIKELHDKLKVTADQEALWAAVAAVMQENESKMHDSITHRAELTRTMNAIDDLKSYQLVTDEHADGLKLLIPVFEALYQNMSAEQKSNADHVFDQKQMHAKKSL